MKEFFQELQSKRIYRVGGGYIVSAWVILQVAATVSPSLELPSWTMKVVLDMLLLGFAPALLLGWHLDLRRERAERSSLLKKDVGGDPQSPSEHMRIGVGLRTSARTKTEPRRWLKHWLFYAFAALLVLVAAWRLAGGTWTAAPVALPTSAPEVKPAGDLSIVVLPFANLSNDPAQDYFAAGLTQNLTNDLWRIGGLVIIPGNTAFAYKGKAVDARQIGKELGVRY